MSSSHTTMCCVRWLVRALVFDGFTAPEAKGGIAWLDRYLLLLSSALGEGMATNSGADRQYAGPLPGALRRTVLHDSTDRHAPSLETAPMHVESRTRHFFRCG
jgi:hypothetical protein